MHPLILLATALLAQAAPPSPSASPEAEAAQPAPEPVLLDEKSLVETDNYVVRLSLPTDEDRAIWLQPGIRVELAIGGAHLWGRGPAPTLSLVEFRVRARFLLEERWSLSAEFGYGIVVENVFSGLRWAATLGPTFHPVPPLGISLGLGYGGFAGAFGDDRAPPSGVASRTLSDREALSACEGGGWVGRARVEYLFVVGQLFSTGPFISGDMQWTGCEQGLGDVDRETGLRPAARQWWLHGGGSAGWWLSWR